MRPDEKQIADNSHIYIVCRRPSLRFDPNSFIYENGFASGELLYYIDGIENRIAFSTPFELLDGATHLRISSYPHREIRTYSNDDKEVRHLPASFLSIGAGQHLVRPALANLEVLYIGQSFASGNRSAFDRLQSHATLQKILAEAAYENPDSEIFVALFVYEPYRVLTLMDGKSSGAISDDRDSRRFTSIMERPLKKSQQVSLAEAALIRYFEPKYNTIFKSKFPSKRLKVLSSCYELDFSGLVVELNTENLQLRLFSPKVAPATHHMSKIELFSHSDRAGFFFYTDQDGNLRQSMSTIG